VEGASAFMQRGREDKKSRDISLLAADELAKGLVMYPGPKMPRSPVDGLPGAGKIRSICPSRVCSSEPMSPMVHGRPDASSWPKSEDPGISSV
jgi:hypothetical protein